MTVIRFKVGVGGTVKDAFVEASSGDNDLDDTALVCVEGWQFHPAMLNAQPLEVELRAGYRFPHWGHVGDDPPVVPPADKTIQMPLRVDRDYIKDCDWRYSRTGKRMVLAFSVGTSGLVKDVSVVESSGDLTADNIAVQCMLHRSYHPATRNGEPIEVRMSEAMY